MRIIYCSDPFNPRAPDPAYDAEVAAAGELGLAYDLVSYEALVYDDSPLKAVRQVEEQPDPVLGIYRGWMLKPEEYAKLYEAIMTRGIRLINDPAAYKHCHYLPESYSLIQEQTPRSLWLEMPVDIGSIIDHLRPFGSSPLILKDYVKSRKHEWEEACYIPSASDRAGVERVVKRFIELQGDDLNEGLVFREYVDFEPLATHSKSGMPLTKEYRIFYLDNKPVYWVEYWEEGDYEGAEPPLEAFDHTAAKVHSRFFTMDVAKARDGDWLIVELGDAQVAGLPDNAGIPAFYQAIIASLKTLTPDP
jgi:hypothetical protein